METKYHKKIKKKHQNQSNYENPRIPIFYVLPEVHKPGNPGRPVLNGIGSITEKLSTYVLNI